MARQIVYQSTLAIRLPTIRLLQQRQKSGGAEYLSNETGWQRLQLEAGRVDP